MLLPPIFLVARNNVETNGARSTILEVIQLRTIDTSRAVGDRTTALTGESGYSIIVFREDLQLAIVDCNGRRSVIGCIVASYSIEQSKIETAVT